MEKKSLKISLGTAICIFIIIILIIALGIVYHKGFVENRELKTSEIVSEKAEEKEKTSEEEITRPIITGPAKTVEQEKTSEKEIFSEEQAKEALLGYLEKNYSIEVVSKQEPIRKAILDYFNETNSTSKEVKFNIYELTKKSNFEYEASVYFYVEEAVESAIINNTKITFNVKNDNGKYTVDYADIELTGI